MDISADLTELGRTPVAVVCAGAKSLLDIGRKHKELALQDGNNRLNLQSGIIIAVPIPAQFAASASVVERAIQQALKESNEKNVSGRDVTPFLLKRVSELTGGESLKSNISLIKNNAAVGAQIAKAYASLLAPKTSIKGKGDFLQLPSRKSAIVIGGMNMDVLGRPDEGQKLEYRTSNTGSIAWRSGGVARNVAEALHRCGTPTLFISTCGQDYAGKLMLDHMHSIDMPTFGVKEIAGERTCIFAGVMDEGGDLVAAITDVHVFRHITLEYIISNFKDKILRSSLVAIDGNFPTPATVEVVNFAHAHGVPVLFEPTSVPLSTKVIEGGVFNKISYITPAERELEAMSIALGHKPTLLKANGEIDLEGTKEAIACILKHGPTMVLSKFGPHGVVAGFKNDGGSVTFLQQEAIPAKIVNTVGAGDSFAGAFFSALLQGLEPKEALLKGVTASKLTIEHENTVSPLITPELIKSQKARL